MNIHFDYPVTVSSLSFEYVEGQNACLFNWKLFDSREALTAFNLDHKVLLGL